LFLNENLSEILPEQFVRNFAVKICPKSFRPKKWEIRKIDSCSSRSLSAADACSDFRSLSSSVDSSVSCSAAPA
jgi:hypothetical protein